MSTLAERITAQEKLLTASKDMLVELTKNIEDNLSDDLAIAALEEKTAEVETITKQLSSLKNAEKALAAREVTKDTAVSSKPANSKGSMDTLVKGITAMAIAKATGSNPEVVSKERYGNDQGAFEMTKAVVAPAITTTAGWAAELVRDSYGDFMEALRPVAVFPQVPAKRFSFNGSHTIRIPMGVGGGLAGGFVGEGGAIPVKKGSVSLQTLSNYKMAVISTYTREMFQQSNPNIESYIRSGILDDTALALDTAFLSANAAVAGVSPAGIQNGIALGDTAVSAGNTLDNILEDLKGRMASMYSQNLGKRPVWIMNSQNALALGFVTSATGDWMFRDELTQGKLQGIPTIVSNSVPVSVIFLVDAAELAVAYDNPEFTYSESASLHMDDAAVGDLGGTTANVRSLYQTDTAALRMILPISWKVLRAGAVQTITGVAYAS